MAGRGLDHHRVVDEAADVREARVRPGRAEVGVGEEPGQLRGVQPDGGDPVAAGPVGAAGTVRVGGPLRVQRGGAGGRRARHYQGLAGGRRGRGVASRRRRGQQAERDAQPGGQPDGQAADLEAGARATAGRPQADRPYAAGRRTANHIRASRRRGAACFPPVPVRDAGAVGGLMPFARAPAGWKRPRATGRRPGPAGRAAAARRGSAPRPRSRSGTRWRPGTRSAPGG